MKISLLCSTKNLTLLLLVLLILSMTLSDRCIYLSSYVLIPLFIVSFREDTISKLKLLIRPDLYLLINYLLYGFMCCYFLYYRDYNRMVFYIPLIILPIIIGNLKDSKEGLLSSMMNWIDKSIILLPFLSVFLSILNALNIHSINIDELLVVHRPYLGMYFGVAIIFLYFKEKFKYRLYLILVYVFIMILLATKMALLGLVCSFFIYIISRLKKTSFKFLIYLGVLCLIVAISSKIVQFNYDSVNNTDYFYKYVVNSFGTRVVIWRDYINMFLDNYVGYGDTHLQYYNAIQARCCPWFFNFNPHSEFLFFAIYFGFIGLVFLISYLSVYYRCILSNNDFGRIVFVFLVLTMCTECILERQWGIIFFSFMISYLPLKKLERNEFYS